MVTEIEKLTEPKTIIIKSRSIKGWDSGEPMDLITKSTIIYKIVLALGWDGFNVIE
jgi:hypothetical protein